MPKQKASSTATGTKQPGPTRKAAINKKAELKSKPLTLERAIKLVAKSDTMKSARLCPCPSCRNRVRHLVWGLMGYEVDQPREPVLDLAAMEELVNGRSPPTEAPYLEGIDEATVAAVELGIEDLMTQLFKPVDQPRSILLMPVPTTMAGSGYPKGGKQ